MYVNAPIICDSLYRITLNLIDEKNVFKNTADSLRDVVAKVEVVNDSLQKFFSENVTADALVKSQEFYNSAFKDIQSSYNLFLIIVGIFVAIVCATGIWNWWQVGKLKKELKDKFQKNGEYIESLGRLVSLTYYNEIKDEKNDDKKQLESGIMLLIVTREFNLYIDNIIEILNKINSLIKEAEITTDEIKSDKYKAMINEIFDYHEFCYKDIRKDMQRAKITEIISALKNKFGKDYINDMNEQWEKDRAKKDRNKNKDKNFYGKYND